MIAQVTDCAAGIGAVTMRRPLSSRSRRYVDIEAMLAGAIFSAVDEAYGLPGVVDRGALVVYEPSLQADALDGVEVEVRLEPRGLLRPGDPEAVRRAQRSLQHSEPAPQLGARGREEHQHF